MKKILLDTNALISFIIDRDEAQNQMVYEILSGKYDFNVYLISNVISEFVYVLQRIYLVPSCKISQMVKDLLKMPNLDFVEGYFPDVVFKVWPDKIKDFGDSVIASASLVMKIPVYTFDKKLSAQLKRIKCKHKLLTK